MKSPPAILKDDPLRKKERIEMDEPNLAYVRIVNDPPNLMEPRSERFEPQVKKSNNDTDPPILPAPRTDILEPTMTHCCTDNFRQDPTATLPKAEQELPTLANCLIEIALPKYCESKTDTALPSVAALLTDTELPIWSMQQIEHDPPIAELAAFTLTEEPTRRNCLREKDEPRVQKSKTEALEPVLTIALTEIEEAMCRKL